MANPSQSHTARYRLTADAVVTSNVRPLKGQVLGTIPNLNRRAGARLLAASSGQAGHLVYYIMEIYSELSHRNRVPLNPF